MAPMIPIFLLLLAPAVMWGIHLLRPAFSYHWLIAALAALFAWPFVLFTGINLPRQILLVPWERQSLFGAGPVLLVDGISWSFALALVSLLFAALFTAVARPRQGSWRSWAGSCFLTGLGLAAVQSGNPLALILAWAAIDLAELFILLVRVYESDALESVVIAFSVRVGGIVLLIAAGIAAPPAGAFLDFSNIPPVSALLILLSAGLRLGVLPLNLPFLQELTVHWGLRVTRRLVPAATSLVVLVRVSAVGIPPSFVPYLLGLAGLVGLYAAISWVIEKDEMTSRSYWLLGISSFVFAAAVRANPGAALAWSLACILPGGFMFLASAHPRGFVPLAVMGLSGFTALPYTPAWSGSDLFIPLESLQNNLPLLLFALSLALLFAGYARYAFRPKESLAGTERWVGVIYILGLALLPFTHYLLGWRIFSTQPAPPAVAWVAGLVCLALAAGMWALRVRLPEWNLVPLAVRKIWHRIFSWGWLYQSIWNVYHAGRRIMEGISLLLEGEAGILWALLILALIFSLTMPGAPGG